MEHTGIFKDLSEKAVSLQNHITQIFKCRDSSKNCIKFLVYRDNKLKLRMDANKNHQRPHVHLDFGGEHHVASYAIDTGECLAGDDTLCGKAVSLWIENNRELLLKVWEITRDSPQPDDLIADLKASEFWS